MGKGAVVRGPTKANRIMATRAALVVLYIVFLIRLLFTHQGNCFPGHAFRGMLDHRANKIFVVLFFVLVTHLP